MEKKEKKGKNITAEVKNSEEIKNKHDDNRVIFSKKTKGYAKIIAQIVAFLAAAACIFVFVFGIITSLKAINYSKDELLRDNFSITFISNLSKRSINDTKMLVENFESKPIFVVFEIILPTIMFAVCMVLLIILLINILSFINDVTKEKDLFNKNNLYKITKMVCYIEVIITVSFLIFGSPSLFNYLLTSFLLYFTLYLFTRCCNYEK